MPKDIGGGPRTPKRTVKKAVTPTRGVPKQAAVPEKYTTQKDAKQRAAAVIKPKATSYDVYAVSSKDTVTPYAKKFKDTRRGTGQGGREAAPKAVSGGAYGGGGGGGKKDRDRDRAGETDAQRKRRTGGGSSGGGSLGSPAERSFGGYVNRDYDRPIGKRDGADVRDFNGIPGLVGSQNRVQEFDGTEYDIAPGGGSGGGGGGTGAAVSGLASATRGLSAKTEGKTLEEYIGRGAKKTRRTGQKRTQ
jgi:hypothetical protein